MRGEAVAQPVVGRKAVSQTAVACAVVAFSSLLAAVFWWPLWTGGGLVGGDVYSYYLPQKVVYAEALAQREIPLWNNRAGHGYPLVAESQTGVFYPPNLVLYRLLDVNTAYNANHLLHYVLALAFAWMFARSLDLSRGASALVATVYTYAWFPARSCWEWAIIGGAWLPAAFWCAEMFLRSRHWRYAFALTAVLALQLLAGHYNLAFITQVTLVVYVVARLWAARDRLPESKAAIRGRSLIMIGAAFLAAFALAAVQLLPTLELKALSQRSAPGANHPLAHGSIPAWYWDQFLRPWHWYAVDVNRDAELAQAEPSLGAKTNQVEAHLYFGLVPLGLALAGIVLSVRSRDRVRVTWAVLGLAALLYTPGWLLPVTQHLPGFNFFQGPGRWGIVTTLAVAILAGTAFDRLRRSNSLVFALWSVVAIAIALLSMLTLAAKAVQAAESARQPSPFRFGPFAVSDALLSGVAVIGIVTALAAVLFIRLGSRDGDSSTSRIGRSVLSGCLLAATVLDLWVVVGLEPLRYSVIVNDPPIRHLADSPVHKILAKYHGTARLFSRGANLPTVLDAASTPAYLTFGPAAYVDPQLRMPHETTPENVSSLDQVAWLQRAGVTHVLSFESLSMKVWPVKFVWQGFDPVLNPAWARFREPLFLYALAATRGRVSWADLNAPSIDGDLHISEFRNDLITIETNSPAGGRLVLRDLMYPGWEVSVDGERAAALTFDGMYRAVDVPAGQHVIVWSYHPRSLYWGAAIGFVTLILLAIAGHVRFWHPQRCRFLDVGQ